jgi:hypothetical protein
MGRAGLADAYVVVQLLAPAADNATAHLPVRLCVCRLA